MNEFQQRAVEAPNGYVQIIAGPGTGKTFTLVSRIVEMLNRGIDARRICVLSFTRAAARELKIRVSEKVGKDCPIIIGTFHSIAARFLKKFGDEKQRKLKIIDETEKAEIIASLCPDHGQRKQLAKLFSQLQTQLTLEKIDEEAQRMFDQYLELLHSLNRVDYDGLLAQFLLFLKGDNSKVGSLDAVLVDEFQDTSLLQLQIAMKLATTCQNITVVGDPDQSIYAFRNANPQNFKEMVKMVPAGETVQQLYLEYNYRSIQSILDASHRLLQNAPPNKIANGSSAATKVKLKAKAFEQPGESHVKMAAAGSYQQENHEIAEHIVLLLKGGINPSEICVLSRQSTRFRSLATELLLRGIKTRSVGGKVYMMQREMRTIIDYIRVALDSHDSLAISRTLNFPSRKIGPSRRAKVCEQGSHWPSMALIKEQAAKTAAFQEFVSFTDSIKQKLGSRQGLEEVEAAIVHCFDTIFAHPVPEEELSDDSKQAEETDQVTYADVTAADELIQISRDLASMIEEDQVEQQPNETFAQQLVAILALRSNDHKSATDVNECVTLSTIHSAKGLEWPVVFVANVGSDPSSMGQQLSADDTEEERRLLYVALTRAKGYLVVTSPGFKMDSLLNLSPILRRSVPDTISAEVDEALMSHCINRPFKLVAPMVRKECSAERSARTRLGEPIDLTGDFILASELPASTTRAAFAQPPVKRMANVNKPKKSVEQPKPSMKSKPNKQSILAFFSPK